MATASSGSGSRKRAAADQQRGSAVSPSAADGGPSRRQRRRASEPLPSGEASRGPPPVTRSRTAAAARSTPSTRDAPLAAASEESGNETVDYADNGPASSSGGPPRPPSDEAEAALELVSLSGVDPGEPADATEEGASDDDGASWKDASGESSPSELEQEENEEEDGDAQDEGDQEERAVRGGRRGGRRGRARGRGGAGRGGGRGQAAGARKPLSRARQNAKNSNRKEAAVKKFSSARAELLHGKKADGTQPFTVGHRRYFPAGVTYRLKDGVRVHVEPGCIVDAVFNGEPDPADENKALLEQVVVAGAFTSTAANSNDVQLVCLQPGSNEELLLDHNDISNVHAVDDVYESDVKAWWEARRDEQESEQERARETAQHKAHKKTRQYSTRSHSARSSKATSSPSQTARAATTATTVGLDTMKALQLLTEIHDKDLHVLQSTAALGTAAVAVIAAQNSVIGPKLAEGLFEAIQQNVRK